MDAAMGMRILGQIEEGSLEEVSFRVGDGMRDGCGWGLRLDVGGTDFQRFVTFFSFT